MNLLAQTNEEVQIPSSVEEIKTTLLETVGGVWSDFLSHLPYIVAGLLVLVGTWIVAGIAVAITRKVMSKKKDLRPSLRELALRFMSMAIWAAGLMLASMIIFPGLTPAKALGALGLLSVAIGLAFKDIFENFFAGILLLLKFPFEKGDFIECEGITGVVEDVQVRMTEIRKSTGELVVVPNSVLFKNPVDIFTARPQRRIHKTVGVAYGEDVTEAVETIKGALDKCSTVDDSKPIEIYPADFGSSSVDIDVAWWTDARPGEVRRSVGEVITSIKKALDREGIEIPFPYRTLTFAEPVSVDAVKTSLETQAR